MNYKIITKKNKMKYLNLPEFESINKTSIYEFNQMINKMSEQQMKTFLEKLNNDSYLQEFVHLIFTEENIDRNKDKIFCILSKSLENNYYNNCNVNNFKPHKFRDKYIGWVSKNYVMGNISKIEDLFKIKEAIKDFEILKNNQIFTNSDQYLNQGINQVSGVNNKESGLLAIISKYTIELEKIKKQIEARYNSGPVPLRISDYKKSFFLIPKTYLRVDIYEDYTLVTARYKIKPTNNYLHDLILNGDPSLDLISVKNNIRDVPYHIDTKDEAHDLVIKNTNVFEMLKNNKSFVLKITCKIYPDKNDSLKGMFIVDGIYCTQCEAQGFRKIIYSFDRPDVLSFYKIRISANKKRCPIILSNGNNITHANEPGDSNLYAEEPDNTRHFVIYQDPYPQPSYLLAIVAGNLGFIESFYTIQNQKENNEITIRIYARIERTNQLQFAMRTIKLAMQWFADKFDLSYDLKLLNLVSLDGFDKGAMENKGLNIFNTEDIEWTIETATDNDSNEIIYTIGHEYFHNWFGNRVTVEKWFDVTVKEGLTMFCEQNFLRDIGSSPQECIIKRAQMIINEQFYDDSGSYAHPIRPNHYKYVDDLYTSTIYDKGAEIIRIYETLLGVSGFRKGIDLYIKRYDGLATACEDFWKSMLDANTVEHTDSVKYTIKMKRLFNWYYQPGTPMVKFSYFFDVDKKLMIISLTQTNPKCKELNGTYEPVLIPIKMGLIDRHDATNKISPSNVQISDNNEMSFILNFYELEQEFILYDIPNCIPSLLRDFSAPVEIDYEISWEDRFFLLKNDTNGYNRWVQSQIIHKKYMYMLYYDPMTNIDTYINTLTHILEQPMDNFLKYYLLEVSSINDMYEIISKCDPLFLYENVIQRIYKKIASNSIIYLEKTTYDTMNLLLENPIDDRSLDDTSSKNSLISSRKLLKIVMRIRLLHFDEKTMNYVNLIQKFFNKTKNFTEKSYCIDALSTSHDPEQKIWNILQNMLDSLADSSKNNSLMIERWLKLNSNIRSHQTVHLLTDLYNGTHRHSKMIDKNNSKYILAIVKLFTKNPFVHQIANVYGKDFAPGYEFLTNCIIDIDSWDSITSGKIATFFDLLPKLSPRHQECMHQCIADILINSNISDQLRDILTIN